MSDPFDRPTPPTSSDWAVPIASWGENVAQSRERIARLARSGQASTSGNQNFEIIRELGLTVEELSVAEEELRAQNEQLQRAQFELERDRVRYQALFHRAPVPYVVTNAAGVISNANAAASALLRVR